METTAYKSQNDIREIVKMGLVGLNIIGMLGGPEIFIYLFGAVGVSSPGLYV